MFAGESFQSRRFAIQLLEKGPVKLPAALAADNEITSPLPFPLNSPKSTEEAFRSGSNPEINLLVPSILATSLRSFLSSPAAVTTLPSLTLHPRHSTSLPVASSNTNINNALGSGGVSPPTSINTLWPFTSPKTPIFSRLKPKAFFSAGVNLATLNAGSFILPLL